MGMSPNILVQLNNVLSVVKEKTSSEDVVTAVILCRYEDTVQFSTV